MERHSVSASVCKGEARVGCRSGCSDASAWRVLIIGHHRPTPLATATATATQQSCEIFRDARAPRQPRRPWGRSGRCKRCPSPVLCGGRAIDLRGCARPVRGRQVRLIPVRCGARTSVYHPHLTWTSGRAGPRGEGRHRTTLTLPRGASTNFRIYCYRWLQFIPNSNALRPEKISMRRIVQRIALRVGAKFNYLFTVIFFR